MGSGAAACARRRAARCSRHQGAEQGSAEGRLGAAGLRAPLRPPQKCRLQGVLGAIKWLPPPSPEPHAAARPAREARERGQAAGPGAAGPTRGSAHSTAGARDAAAHRKRLPARRAARSRSGAPRRDPWTAVRSGLAAAAHANLTGRERRRPAGWRVSCGLPGPSNCRDFPGKHAGPAAKLPAHRNRQLQGSSVQKTGESRPGQVHLPKNWKCVFKAKLKQFWSNKAKSNICDKLCPQL